MANKFSYLFPLFVILVLLEVGSTLLIAVEGDVCSEAMGECPIPQDCDKRCKAKHSGGQGSCDMRLCTCNYPCGPPSPPAKDCTANLGECTLDGCMDKCCNAKCAKQFNQGVGFCYNSGLTPMLCTCKYVCSS